MKKLFSLVLIVLFAVSCKNDDDVNLTPEDAKPIAMRAALQKRVGQDNAFAFDLLKKTISYSTQSNIVVSPLSVSIALGMTWNGANGTTKTEMETALKMSGMSATDINDYYRVLQTSLPSIDPKTKLCIANSLWYRTGLTVKQAFLDVNTTNFNTYVKSLDFSQAAAKETINNWCSENTKGLIPSIIDVIPSNAMMYLINAVYFKGIWRQQFDKKQTSESTFTNEQNTAVKVNMMNITNSFNYASDANAQYLDMPYGNKAFSMTVILPAANKTTSEVLNTITPESWSNVLASMLPCEVMVKLPRFKVENKFDNLQPELTDMGMPLAFSQQADFSGISDRGLYISKVIHKTYITVDEEGTEAAAVTAVAMELTALPNHRVFSVNKPFLFVIRENSTGVILFIGKMGTVDKY